MKKVGTIYGVGVGPGDPELITVKGLNVIRQADIIAFHQTKKANSNALRIAQQWLRDDQNLLSLTYPVTTEIQSNSQEYNDILEEFYFQSAKTLKEKLEQGLNIAVLTEGDPSFYSSFMYILDNLKGKYPVKIIPGVSSLFAAAASLQAPLSYRNETFCVLSAVLPYEELVAKLKTGDTFAIMKVGRNFDKIKNALVESDLDKRALYIERASMSNEKIIPLKDVDSAQAPYFSIILVPGKSWLQEK